MNDLAEILALSVLLEDIIGPRYVNCLTTSTAWPLISTVESGADAVFPMGMIFVFFSGFAAQLLRLRKRVSQVQT